MTEDSHDPLADRVDEALAMMDRDQTRGMGLLIDVLQVDPEHFYALGTLSQVLLSQGHHESAAQAARRLIEHYPNEDLGYARVAEALLAQKQYTQAERYAEEAVAKDPCEAENFATLADIRERSRGPAAAEQALVSAVELDPDNPGHRIRLGFLRVQLGRAAKGLPDLLAAVDLGADDRELRLMLQLIADFGLPAPLQDLYGRISYLVGRPDLTQPGSAGADPELLAEQAAVAKRLAMSLDQDEPTTLAAWRRSRELAEEILAADPDNDIARETLKILDRNRSIAYKLYSDPAKADAYVASFRELSERIRTAYAAFEHEPTAASMGELFTIAGDMLRVIEAAGTWDTPAAQAAIEVVTKGVSEARTAWRPGPGEAEAAAQSFADAGLIESFAEFYGWLAEGAPPSPA